MQKLNLKSQNDKEKFKKDFYHRLIKFSVNCIKFCNVLRKNKNYYFLADQLARSSTSIGANVIEAKSSSSKKDYINYFQIALKSANETKYWFLLCKELDEIEYKVELYDECVEILKIIASGILTMKGKK